MIKLTTYTVFFFSKKITTAHENKKISRKKTLTKTYTQNSSHPASTPSPADPGLATKIPSHVVRPERSCALRRRATSYAARRGLTKIL